MSTFFCTCLFNILLLLQQSEKQLTLTTLFQQPMATSYTTFTGACAAFTSPAISILLHCTINTGKPANLLHTHKASGIYDRPRSLFDAHSPRQPSVSPASPAFSAPESYFTMHASYLIICPRFTLGVAAVTEKNGGQTDGRTHAHTHTHTDRPTAITLRCACAQARVNKE